MIQKSYYNLLRSQKQTLRLLLAPSQRSFVKKYGKSELDNMPKSDYSPFKINLDKSQTTKKSEGFGVMDKLKTFFQSTEKDKVKGSSKEEVKGKTVNDQYQEMKKKWLIGEKY